MSVPFFNKNYLFLTVLLCCVYLAVYPLTTRGNVPPNRVDRQDSLRTGMVSGKTVNSEGNALAGVTISLQKQRQQTVSNDEGLFSLQVAMPFDGQLYFSYLGNTIAKKITLSEGSHKRDIGMITFSLTENTLEEVNITDLWQNKFSKKESSNIAKMPLKNLENPQTYTVIPRELLEEQVVTDFGSALRNAPGVVIGPRVDNGRNVFLLRGFQESSYMRNGLASPAYMDVDPVNLESIEVIKGPSGTLYGSSLISFGGLINRVTKKPLDHFTGSASLVAGGYNLYRATADINTPVNKDSSLLARLNLALNRQGSFQDYGYSKTFMLAPVISYQVNPKLQLILEAEIYNRDATALPGYTITGDQSGISNVNQLNTIYKRSFSTNQLNMTGGSKAYFAQANYEISSNWKSQSSLSYSINNYYRVGMRSYVLNDSLIRRVGGDVDYSTEALNLQQNFVGKVRTGDFEHRLLLGLDYLQRNNFLYNNLARGAVDTINYRTGNTPFISRTQIESLAAGIAKNPSNSANNTYATYVSDVIDYKKRLFLMLSLRYDYYDNKGSTRSTTGETTGNYRQGSWSPKMGVVYQLLPERLSLFSNYMNGFVNINGQDVNGETFKPQQANQWEAGVKTELLNRRLNVMVSYYDIAVSNALRTDLQNPDFSIQDGKQSSRGLEAEVIANLLPGLNLIAGYGYNKSRYTEADAAIQGNRPADIPNHNANFWASYMIPNGTAKGLGFGLGGNYIGSTFYNDSNSITVPSAFILNSSIYLAKPKYRIALKGDNLTNRYYWASLNPQMPFRLSGSLQLYF
jgi:iron complex outermembrane recepter protein